MLVEYIKKSDALDLLKSSLPVEIKNEYMYELDGIWLDDDDEEKITTELVEVVRCKDCKSYDPYDYTEELIGKGFCHRISDTVKDDDFCSYGKKVK